MRHTTTERRLAAVLLIALAGCTSVKNEMTGPVVGVPIDLPDRFKVPTSGIDKSVDPKPGEGCRNPMVDPRDKTLLDLRRSADGIGDYWVQSGKYGVTSRQFLRVDCATGKAIGIVDQ